MLQYTMFDGIQDTDEEPVIQFTRVTCWYRWNKKRNRWEHNHYSLGWVNSLFPTPRHPDQEVWLQHKWKTKHNWLNHENKRIYTSEELIQIQV